MPALRRMSISGNVSRQPFSERHQQAYTAGVAAFVSLAPHLACLGMACMHLTDSDAPALATCLHRLSHLRELDLHSNNLTLVGGAAIGAVSFCASALVHLLASGADSLTGVHLKMAASCPHLSVHAIARCCCTCSRCPISTSGTQFSCRTG